MRPTSWVTYVLDDWSDFERKLSLDSPSEGEGEANLLGHGYRKVVLPRI